MSVEQNAVNSMTQTIFSATSYIKALKQRVLARNATIAQREATIAEQGTIIAARDSTITERNGQIDAYLGLVDGLRAQVTQLGGSIEATEALYQEQLLLKEAALQERELSEANRLELDRQRQILLEQQFAAIEAEAEEDRVDALRLKILADAMDELATEASGDVDTTT